MAVQEASTFEFLRGLCHHLQEGESLAEALSHAEGDLQVDPDRVSQTQAHIDRLHATHQSLFNQDNGD